MKSQRDVMMSGVEKIKASQGASPVAQQQDIPQALASERQASRPGNGRPRGSNTILTGGGQMAQPTQGKTLLGQ